MICDYCQSNVPYYEGEHGRYIGQCQLCGAGYGGHPTDFIKFDAWSKAQAETDLLDQMKHDGYYLVINEYAVIGPYKAISDLIDSFLRMGERDAYVYKDKVKLGVIEAHGRYARTSFTEDGEK